MYATGIFRCRGWRRAAAVNTILASILTLLLAVLVAVIASRTGSVFANLTFHIGTCKSADRVNLLLHLVINIIATGLIASSNFFMQVLNAPSRAEVDAAHRKHKYLKIGVQSMGNLLHISWFKIAATAVFTLSSLPVHLLFNSAVFETEIMGRDWQMIYAAEPFVNGGDFTMPGAYLAPSGFWPNYPHDKDPNAEFDEYAYNLEKFLGSRFLFGAGKNLSEYQNMSSPVVGNITRAAKSAAGWTRMSPLECRQQYIYCEPRSRYGNVVMVLNGFDGRNATGWTRSEVFPSMKSDSAEFWDDFGVLEDRSNSLWWSAECGVMKDPFDRTGQCRNLCAEGMGTFGDYGGSEDPPYPVLSTEANWTIVVNAPSRAVDKYFAPNYTRPREPWMWSSNQTLDLQHRSGFDFNTFTRWNLSYCLAEEITDQCKVGVSGIILLLVTICSALKTLQCIVVLVNLKEEPLVTPGDAIESFLVLPDSESRSLCTVGYNDYIGLRKQGKYLEDFRGPGRWGRTPKFVFSAIRKLSWLATYVLFLAGLILAGVLLGNAKQGYLGHKDPNAEDDATAETYTGFDHSLQNGAFNASWVAWGRFLPSIAVANLPQLVVSFCYFVYNGVWTSLISEVEWNAFALGYKPLRVSTPKGGQVSTYRLQLPLLYGIPLIAGSILLHWLVSNALYVVMIEGEYLTNPNFIVENTMGFQENTYINIGYSSGPILISIIACSIIAVLPLIFSFARRLRGNMPLAGNSSLIMAAACHVLPSEKTPFSPPRTPRADEKIAENETLMGGTKSGWDGEEAELERRIAMSRSKLRWGVVNVKQQTYEDYRDHVVMVGHLSFAGEDEYVAPPEKGRWYE